MELEVDASRFGELCSAARFYHAAIVSMLLAGHPRNNELIRPRLHKPAMHLER